MSLGSRLQELNFILSNPDFWTDPDVSLCKERGRIENILGQQQSLSAHLEECAELLSWEEDEALVEVESLLSTCDDILSEHENHLKFPEDLHENSAILTLTAGAGGQESQHWVVTMMRAYTRWAVSKGWTADLMSWTDGVSHGLAKSVTLQIRGAYAYGHLRVEKGPHRFCRVSPFDSSGRVHTSFISVDVVPEIEESRSEIKLVDSELDISTYRSSGPGGQHANKTDSAVRIKHLPTGIVVACQEERSQTMNRVTARKMLISRLEAIRREEEEAQHRDRHGAKKEAAFGHQIRSYEMHQSSYIRDHRTNQTVYQPEKVLDGDFNALVDTLLMYESQGEPNGVFDVPDTP